MVLSKDSNLASQSRFPRKLNLCEGVLEQAPGASGATALASAVSYGAPPERTEGSTQRALPVFKVQSQDSFEFDPLTTEESDSGPPAQPEEGELESATEYQTRPSKFMPRPEHFE